MKRPIIFTFVVAIPLVIFWALILRLDPTRIVPEIPSSAPKWIEKGTYGTCSDAMSGTPITNKTVAIDEARAARIGVGVIQSQTDLLTISGRNVVAFKPELVERQFPDNQSHLAWVFGEGRITDEMGMSATVEIIYIDAATGDPLLLIKGLFAGDPSFTCPQLGSFDDYRLKVMSQQTVLYLVALLLTAAYGVAVMIVRPHFCKRQDMSESLDNSIKTH